jgi:hypothetical protein
VNKPGFTTSEWWTTIIVQLVAVLALLHPGFAIGGEWVQALALIGSAVSGAAYTHGRARVKVAAGSALVVAPGPATDIHTEPLVQRDKT